MPKKVAVVLSGCGVQDGSEIHEAVSVLIHVDRHGWQGQCFAPDGPTPQVVNHLTGKPSGEQRSMLVEAARIARGKIKPLAVLQAADYDAVIFPGGFGAAKNLCTFAVAAADCSVMPDVARVIKGFHAAGKPIGLCCIAPVLAAKVLGVVAGGPGCGVTVGPAGDVGAAIEKMGSRHVVKAVKEAHVDEANKLVTTPAYMCEAGPAGVFEGIGVMIDRLALLMGV